MPYIKQEKKCHAIYDQRDAGELNFKFTMLIQKYIKAKGECYQTYNDVLGALMGCMLELYRRRVSNYEDKKIVENGDVY